MKFTHLFIDRPILATVISVLIIIVGAISYVALPVTQYPEIAPPTINVVASYPGANAQTVSESVATPLEQEINGVEDMLYMLSQSTGDGNVQLTITFKQGTDLDKAQVLVQNRVAIAEPRLPESVRRIGVTTRKNSPNLMLVVNMYSPDNSYDQVYIANYAVLQIRDRLARIRGVGDTRIFGASEYSMRIWLDPERIATLNITADEILSSLRGQNVQISSGTLNQPPILNQNPFEVNVRTQGRLIEADEFANVIVKTDGDGGIVRVKDIGRVELGAASYVTKGYLGERPAIAIPIFQRPGTNALETAEEVIAVMEEMEKEFPPGLAYEIVYNPTKFVEQSIEAVIETIFEAIILVVLVILIFLQSWRASLIPILAIPVSLIGTFAVMQAFGFSLNNLTLFGLVLAIGIVVDDAIVVVENVERNLEKGLSPREAARATMDEVGTALIAMGLVLVAVFLPTTFLGGISGQFYAQFGLTIAVATMISVLVSLTLSPALAALILKPKSHHKEQDQAGTSFWKDPIGTFSRSFNNGMNHFSDRYGRLIGNFVRRSGIIAVIYVGLLALTYVQFNRVPTGFIPAQDQGYFIVAIQLPPGSSLTRTDQVTQSVIDSCLSIPGIDNTVAFAGFDGATFTISSNTAVVFTPLETFEERESKGITYEGILSNLNQKMNLIDEAFIVVIPPPPVRGIGNAGGFRVMIQDRENEGLTKLRDVCYQIMGAANQDPSMNRVFTFFNTSTPQIYLDIDRVRAEKLGVPVREINAALELFLGSAFVNDFNYLGRTFRVTAQADAPYRLTPDDVLRIRVRNQRGEMIPLGTVAKVKDVSGPSRVPRYNLYPAASIQGDVAPGYSSGEVLDKMEQLVEQILPPGFGYEWTEIAYQQKQAGNTAGVAFALAVVFVFLLLAGQFESFVLPLAIVLIVPMCLLSAMIGIDVAGLDNNILTQIGLVVLVGLASKNAILIVEFAKQLEDQGKSTSEAAIEAARLRLRPILMTAFSFILGVLPLVTASGAGAEMRRALGTAVFSGMLGVTVFGLLFTPIFYYLCQKLGSLITPSKRKSSSVSDTNLSGSNA